jgi:DNA-binding transcriptional MerR regulator
VNSSVYLGNYSATPLYNIKAVVQVTDISPSTLRAWERRYQVCRPQRTDSGYRLYSDRDVATILWLKGQVEAGMAISQAVAWLDRLSKEAHGLENVILPDVNGQNEADTTAISPPGVRDLNNLRAELLRALLRYDETDAERVFSEAFALYPLESIGEQLVAHLLIEVGDRWHRGELSVTHEHYITNYLIHRLAVLLRSLPNLAGGPPIWVACMQTEQHEVASILLTLYLRRAGHTVRLIGKDIPIGDFIQEVQQAHPAMLLFSTSMPESVNTLVEFSIRLRAAGPPTPMLGFGGRAFREQPELRNTIHGVYLGDNTCDAVRLVGELLLRKKNYR